MACYKIELCDGVVSGFATHLASPRVQGPSTGPRRFLAITVLYRCGVLDYLYELVRGLLQSDRDQIIDAFEEVHKVVQVLLQLAEKFDGLEQYRSDFLPLCCSTSG